MTDRDSGIGQPTDAVIPFFRGEIDNNPSEQETREWLEAGLAELQAQNLSLTEELVSIIRGWTKWEVVWWRESNESVQGQIEAIIPLPGDRVMRIQLDYKAPPDQSDEITTIARELNTTCVERCGEDVLRYLLTNSRYAIVELYGAKAIWFLRQEAPGHTDAELVRDAEDYLVQHTFYPKLGTPEYAAWFEKRNQQEEVRRQSVHSCSVSLDNTVDPDIDMEEFMQAVRNQTAANLAEQATHFHEAREKYYQARYDTTLDDSTREQFLARVAEIIDEKQIQDLAELWDAYNKALKKAYDEFMWGSEAVNAVRTLLGYQAGSLPHAGIAVFGERMSILQQSVTGLREIGANGDRGYIES